MKAFEDLKESTKKDIIIDGLMRSKGVYLLVSKPKVGNSFLALQLANSLVNNKQFLGFNTNPTSVLYVSTEISELQLKERLEKQDILLNLIHSSLFKKMNNINYVLEMIYY